MKIRIRDNSLRLRLTQSEVRQFEDERMVSAAIAFPQGTFLKYTLVWGNGTGFSAAFNGREITVTVPKEIGKKWLAPEEVGMEDFLPLPEGGKLRLLIEKDFQCLSE